MSSSSLAAQLAPFLPPAHPAVPHATRILVRLRAAAAAGSALGLSPAEMGGLVGVSIVLGCERANATDSIALKTVQKLSSASPRVFASALEKCRTYLAAASQVDATTTPTRGGAGAGATPAPGVARLGRATGTNTNAGAGKKRTPRSARTELDLSGLKNPGMIRQPPDAVASMSTGKSAARAVPIDTEPMDDERLETPSKRRRVDAPPSSASSRRACSSAERTDASASTPAHRLHPAQLLAYTALPPVHPALSIPRPPIALHGTARALYAGPEHAADARVAGVLVPPPGEVELGAWWGVVRAGADGEEGAEEEVRAYHRAEGRRRARAEEVRAVREGRGGGGGGGAVDEHFWTGFGRRRVRAGGEIDGDGAGDAGIDADAGAADGGEEGSGAFRHVSRKGIGAEDDGGQDGQLASWEDRIDDYLSAMPVRLLGTAAFTDDTADLSRASARGGTPAPAKADIEAKDDDEEDDASHLPPPPASALARARSRRQQQQQQQQQARGGVSGVAPKADANTAVAQGGKPKDVLDPAWLSRAEMRGIAVRVWTA